MSVTFTISLNQLSDPFNNLKLRHSVRAYIDYLSDEYKEDDVWNKMAQLWYSYKSVGEDKLMEAIREDIERHQPKYNDYEEVAKRSLAVYIASLRTGKVADPYDYAVEKMVNKICMEDLFRLLFIEIGKRISIHSNSASNDVTVVFI